jgi:Uma2 family endonuclease
LSRPGDALVNILHQPPTIPEPRQHLVLTCVPWVAYEQILDALSEHHVRITYDRGALEFISPLPLHELWKKQFARILDMLLEELDIPIMAYASTTFKREDLERGLEPDECYYLASGARLRDRREIDLTIDPPPDLAIEIENTTSALDRMSIYANLGVPEVWTFDGADVQAHRLVAGPMYEPVGSSPQLPFLPLEEVGPLVNKAANAPDDRLALRALRDWVRQRVLPLYRAAPPPPSEKPE